MKLFLTTAAAALVWVNTVQSLYQAPPWLQSGRSYRTQVCQTIFLLTLESYSFLFNRRHVLVDMLSQLFNVIVKLQTCVPNNWVIEVSSLSVKIWCHSPIVQLTRLLSCLSINPNGIWYASFLANSMKHCKFQKRSAELSPRREMTMKSFQKLSCRIAETCLLLSRRE